MRKNRFSHGNLNCLFFRLDIIEIGQFARIAIVAGPEDMAPMREAVAGRRHDPGDEQGDLLGGIGMQDIPGKALQESRGWGNVNFHGLRGTAATRLAATARKRPVARCLCG
ncbi:MAG: hypothetical protein H5U15_02505 [Roseovarius sp.]|jgi:integrase|nr:hypothetical protein [Roseovarius sp.]